MCLAYVTTSMQHASLQITASCPASIKHSSLQLPRDSSVAVPQMQILILKGEVLRNDHAMNRLSYTPVAIMLHMVVTNGLRSLPICTQ